MSAAYVDASALVKLFKAERETEAFRTALADWPVQVASELIRVEAICTARRLGGHDVLQRAHAALEQINLIPLTAEIIEEPRPTPTAHHYEQWTQSTSPRLSRYARTSGPSSSTTATCTLQQEPIASIPSHHEPRHNASGRSGI